MKIAKRWRMVLVAIVIAIAAGFASRSYLSAALLMGDIEAGGQYAKRFPILYEAVSVQRADFETIKAYQYAPAGADDAPVLIIVHGVHRLGMEEPRLRSLANGFAARGVIAITPELPGIADYTISQTSVETIGATAKAVKARFPGRQVGVLGLSFSGGLALIAAADTRYATSIDYVVAVGAHSDMRRVAKYFVDDTSETPDRQAVPLAAHEYGVLVLIYSDTARFFRPTEAAAARACLRLQLYEKGEASAQCTSRLPADSRARMEKLLHHQLAEIKPQLETFIETSEDGMKQISPSGRLRNLRVPVLILHGRFDNVIPATEAEWLANELPPASVHAKLVTPLISHVEVSRSPGIGDRLRLVAFMAHVLREANGH